MFQSIWEWKRNGDVLRERRTKIEDCQWGSSEFNVQLSRLLSKITFAIPYL